MLYYGADFETIEIEKNKVDVYLWGLADIKSNTLDSVKTGKNIGEFIDECKKLAYHHSVCIYFYNLKFDGIFILDFLFKNGYKLDKENVKPKSKMSFTEIIDDKGIIYQICLKVKANNIYFRCAYRLALVSLEQLARDFNLKFKKLKTDYNTTEKKDEYIKHDVLIVCEYIKKYIEIFKKPKLTIGSQALDEWKKTNKKWYTKTKKLRKELDFFLRKAYRGGVVYLNRKYKNKTLKKAYIYDINSSYAYAMHSISENKFPKGSPCFFTSAKEFNKIKNNFLYIVQFECTFKIKKNAIPCISSLGAMFKQIGKWEEKSDGITELTLCTPDYENFLNCYDIKNLNILKGFYFKESVVGYADKFVNKYFKQKENSSGAVRQFAKLMLNNLSGKFGQKVVGKKEFIVYDEKKDKLYKESIETENSGVYLPYIIFTTAYARKYLCDCIRKNIDNFIYCDTDSMHLTKPAKNISIGSKLGQWKAEETNKIKYIKAKTYFYENKEKKMIYKISGLPKDAVHKLNKIDAFKELKVGYTFKLAKLIPKIVSGGVKLQNYDFTIE